MQFYSQIFRFPSTAVQLWTAGMILLLFIPLDFREVLFTGRFSNIWTSVSVEKMERTNLKSAFFFFWFLLSGLISAQTPSRPAWRSPGVLPAAPHLLITRSNLQQDHERGFCNPEGSWQKLGESQHSDKKWPRGRRETASGLCQKHHNDIHRREGHRLDPVRAKHTHCNTQMFYEKS